MKNLKVKIYTLGCKVNQYDSGRLAAELESAGFVIAKKAADLAIINSCAVTKAAMTKSGRMIKLARKENPEAKVVLVGCWTRAGKDLGELAGVDLVLKTADVKKIVREIASSPDYRLLAMTENESKRLNLQFGGSTSRARYFIKIQDGCEQFCAYCIVPYTRGKLKSRAEREVIDEIRQAAAGYEEIVLSGIHLGMYGKDSTTNNAQRVTLKNLDSRLRPPRLRSGPPRLGEAGETGGNDKNKMAARNDSLASLIKKILKIPGLGRIRLSSIEITEVSDQLIKLMARSGKICRHLHLPLQSGCDKILKSMNRPYDTKYFKNKIARLKRAMPDMAITTDVIAGFPGETEKDFRETEKFIKQIKFSRLHVFPFSAHAQTPAAKMTGQVDKKTKIRRAEILRQLGVKLADEYRKKFRGRELDAVVERINGRKLIGKTEYYFDVEAEIKQNKNNLIGKIVKVKF
ncbi:MAG: MiaB/RimO family radical SAM methylthiotransferase [bacterium]|nr:MiaB/RimO family radical SAM methylthiotransferase [bacterium]